MRNSLRAWLLSEALCALSQCLYFVDLANLAHLLQPAIGADQLRGLSLVPIFTLGDCGFAEGRILVGAWPWALSVSQPSTTCEQDFVVAAMASDGVCMHCLVFLRRSLFDAGRLRYFLGHVFFCWSSCVSKHLWRKQSNTCEVALCSLFSNFLLPDLSYYFLVFSVSNYFYSFTTSLTCCYGVVCLLLTVKSSSIRATCKMKFYDKFGSNNMSKWLW